LIRNTEPHQNRASSAPPSIGPTATPRPLAAAHSAIAFGRWASDVVRTMIDRVAGISSALPRPISPRVTINSSGLVLNAANADATENRTRPANRVARGP
jgi:hypothetical protein